MKKNNKYGKLTAIKCVENREQYWLFNCDCGNKKISKFYRVSSGHTKSCGCLTEKHRKSKSRTYIIWSGIKQRCLNKNIKNYNKYGGRGITICKEWKDSFETFYKDMGEAPSGKSLDRINNNGNYCKSNCRWATDIEQQNNRSNNRFILYKGETKTIAQWSKLLNINYNTLHSRIKRGWDIKRALSL